MRKFITGFVYILAFTVPIVALGTSGVLSAIAKDNVKPENLVLPEIGNGSLHRKAFDAAKPTVAIVLGSDLTESTDFLNPYEVFSASDAYNVYGVASERKITVLSGGLDVVPDYTFEELNNLLGKAPDVVVLPNIPNIKSQQNQPVLTWVKQQSDQGSLIFSICTGAEVFAATGLLDGRTATTHWGDIDRIEKQYPAVNWVRGVRYVDGDSYITSAGILSGIDAVLHFISRRNSPELARSIAQKLHYSTYDFVDNPQVQQYYPGADMSIFAVNMAFHPDHATDGVLLYDGVGELELASIFDTYGASFTTDLLSVAQTRKVITTQHGLQIIPRWSFDNVPLMERMIAPGGDVRRLAAAEVAAWTAKPNMATVVYIHADKPESFAMDAPLQDLARRQNIPTAVMAAKRLEYRPGTVQTEGSGWPLWLMIRPLLLGAASVIVTAQIMKLLNRRSNVRLQIGHPVHA